MNGHAPSEKDPIPPAARPVVATVHRRYSALPPANRPNLADPRAAGGLLKLLERVTLAKCGYYPLPASVIRLGCTPLEHQQRQTRQLVRGELESLRDEIAAELPAAVAVVLEDYAI
jgi:hypothetical protein